MVQLISGDGYLIHPKFSPTEIHAPQAAGSVNFFLSSATTARACARTSLLALTCHQHAGIPAGWFLSKSYINALLKTSGLARFPPGRSSFSRKHQCHHRSPCAAWAGLVWEKDNLHRLFPFYNRSRLSKPNMAPKNGSKEGGSFYFVLVPLLKAK